MNPELSRLYHNWRNADDADRCDAGCKLVAYLNRIKEDGLENFCKDGTIGVRTTWHACDNSA